MFNLHSGDIGFNLPNHVTNIGLEFTEITFHSRFDYQGNTSEQQISIYRDTYIADRFRLREPIPEQQRIPFQNIGFRFTGILFQNRGFGFTGILFQNRGFRFTGILFQNRGFRFTGI